MELTIMQIENTPLLSAEKVSLMMESPDVVIVDARGGADAYERYLKEHLRGAIMLNLESDLSSKGPDPAQGGRHPLPDPKTFEVLLGKIGITPSTHVIVYDDKAGSNAAARFWWMMRAAGHKKIQVVDGGLTALQEAGLPMTKEPTLPGNPKPPYVFKNWGLPTADIETVEQARRAKNFRVLDVREAYRYKGENEPIDLVAGHIPGAMNLPYLSNLEANGKFKTPEALAELFTSALGEHAGKDVIVHCGSGVTACHTLLAMEVAGMPGAQLYVGSWSEWSRNDKPVAKGENG